MKTFLLAVIFSFYSFFTVGFAHSVNGIVVDQEAKGVPMAGIQIVGTNTVVSTDSNGLFELHNLSEGELELRISKVGYKRTVEKIHIPANKNENLYLVLESLNGNLDDVVVTGTMKAVRRSESPVSVEIISSALFKKNPTPSLFESLNMVNGVQPQLNCNVCNTGDIHINGMEGPYTMILIDGMPIVSALSTVYGLSGIPNSMVDRIEVIKGPASSLYGSEAMGGIVNVITKSPATAPLFSADIFATDWGELSVDGSVKFKVKNASTLLGVNYFNFQNKIDKNKDNFTDLTLQNRISVFNKWDFKRKSGSKASLAARYVFEDRWGGEMNWNKSLMGSDSVYAEHIYTDRIELIGLYQLPVKEKIFTQFSYNWHRQDSWYGETPYFATQHVGFLQAYWDKQLAKHHNFLMGAAMRYTVYDDNTPATSSEDGLENQAAVTPLPGFFIQDEWSISKKHVLLAGYRFDYDQHHGPVHSPRLAYKFSPNHAHVFRANFGTGFRVVNLFTEDHAALTGARKVVIEEELHPERSYNANLNYVYHLAKETFYSEIDASAFYSYYTNKIIADFDTDPTKIIYGNLGGHAISKGLSLNTTFTFNFPFNFLLGVTYMDVYHVQGNPKEKIQELHAPNWSGTFTSSYTFPRNFIVDLTANWNGPMRLPILPNDYRPEYSPWYAIVNLQITKKLKHGIEMYGGVKNLLNFVPKDPLMRPFDPFNKYAHDVQSNPNGYTFDPSYNYSSLQGIRSFLGIRFTLQ